MTTKGRLKLRILGTFAAVAGADGAPALDLVSPRHRALLSYLALQPDYSESRERLAALLWGDSTDGQARKRFRQSLLRLRRELETAGVGLLNGERDTLSLDPESVSVDAREFLRLSASSAEQDIDAAAELYRGELLDGVNLDNGAFEDWLRRERFKFRSIAAQVFERGTRAHATRGNADGAIAAAERLVALDPSDEAAQRQLISLLARQRGKSAALAQAEMARRYLKEEFDSDLEPETLQLIATVKQSAPLAAPASPASFNGGAVHAELSPSLVPTDTAADLAPTDTPAPSKQRSSRALWLPALTIGACALAGSVYYGMHRPASLVALQSAANGTTRDASWTPPALASPAATAISKELQRTGWSALLVLPFSAPAEPASARRMAEQITDDLINELSRVPSLRVIAKSTSMKYAGQKVDVSSLGGELGVQYVVDGDVRVEDKKLRVNIALIDTRTRLQSWTARYEHDESDRLAAQDEIARSLARQLHVGIMETRGREADQRDPTIDDMLGKAWAAQNLFSFYRGGTDAGQLFEDVLKRDPKNVSALIGLGAFKTTAVNTQQMMTDGPAVMLRDAEALLKQAQAANPQASLPYYFLGRNAMIRKQPDEALAYLQHALELNPSYAPAYGTIGYILLHTGHPQEAVDNLKYAIKLSPNDHYMGLWSNHLGRAYFELGDYDAAEHWLTQGVSLMPRSPLNHAVLGAFYAYRDNTAAAEAQIVELRKLSPNATLDGLVSLFTGLCRQDSDRPQHLLAGLRKAMSS
jgi:TolB-like protein/DNA-binding SARP family transcriptional activator